VGATVAKAKPARLVWANGLDGMRIDWLVGPLLYWASCLVRFFPLCQLIDREPGQGL
jgi:hypothetical protein